jgi:GNAT superfamily N-acetyltransferase
MVYRDPKSPQMTKGEKREAMHERVSGGTPIGLLAYDGDEPIGWCSVAPRETYPRLERSRTMPRVEEAPTWTVLCFFVKRAHRGTGVTKTLLKGAVKYAHAEGAEVVEGYPFDTAGISSTHRGHSSVFRSAGFTQQGRRWAWPGKAITR